MTSRVILTGDIGGTKTLLRLDGLDEAGTLQTVCQKRYESALYSRFEEILDDFLASRRLRVGHACFGVAGAVIDGVSQATNLPWVLDQAVLSRHLQGTEVKLLNDLEATALGILHLPDDNFVDLNPASETPVAGHRAVIAAGTGLGEALIIENGGDRTVVATEGGHCDFAPSTEEEDCLLSWLRRQFPGHVSYERILSGPGLVNLYHFQLFHSRQTASPRVQAAIAEGADVAAVIGELGVTGDDELCRKSLQMFCRIYGAEAGNLVLKSLALGGVYVAGGIAPKILPLLRQGELLAAFIAKGRFSGLLGKVPVRLVTNTDVVLVGALNWVLERGLRGQ